MDDLGNGSARSPRSARCRGAEAHDDYGAGALIVCDRLVRIYTAEGIEVQALQGLDLVVAPAS